MVTYAQQTDPEKARISSIDTTKVFNAPVVDTSADRDIVGTPNVKPKQTATQTETIPQSPVTDIKTQTPVTKATGDYWTILDKARSVSSRTWSYYNDVYLPKKQAEQQAKTWDITNIEQPAPSKTQMMDTKTIATQYDSWAISAIDLENLRTTDPLKYQEAKAEIERKRTLDAINQNQQDFLSTYKSMFESYVSKWEELTSNEEGKTLREEVFAKYWLDDSNEKIKSYTEQIDATEQEMEDLEDYVSQWDIYTDRNHMINKNRELTRKRTDLIKTRSAELDYYRLWLEQADAVVSDYKEYQQQELDMMGKKFEMLTGMSTMEFEMKDQQARDYLATVDTELWNIQWQIDARTQQQQDTIANTSLLSLYDEFSQEYKAVLATLNPKVVSDILKKVDETNKSTLDTQMKMMWYNLDVEKLNWDKQKYNMEGTKIKHLKEMKDWTILMVNDNGEVVNSVVPWWISNSGLDPSSIADFSIQSRWRSNVQCGELVNDYWRMATGSKMGVANSFQSKVEAIQSQGQSHVPIAWGVFAYDVGKYGHTGIVTAVHPDWSIETLEANIDGTELWSPPVTKTYKPWSYGNWTFSKPPQNNRIIEENAKAMLVWIWWTESERAEYAKMLVERSQQFWGDLKKAKADLWLITKQDEAFLETRKKDIEWLKKSTFSDLSQARTTQNLIKSWNWDAITDVATIVWFLKTIDPASVARESEVASVENAVSLLGKYEQKILKAGTGKKLTEEQRNQIKNTMDIIIWAADRKYSDNILDYVSEFEARWIDYSNYITNVDMKKVINRKPVTQQKTNIEFWKTDQLEYEKWLYWMSKSEDNYL